MERSIMPEMRILRTPAARIDAVEIAVYLGTEASVKIADRFLDALGRKRGDVGKRGDV